MGFTTCALNLALPVKSHPTVIILIYGSLWKIINCHLPSEKCQRCTLQSGYERDSSITPQTPVKVIQPELQAVWKCVQNVIPLLAWEYRTWQCSAESQGFIVNHLYYIKVNVETLNTRTVPHQWTLSSCCIFNGQERNMHPRHLSAEPPN